MPRVDGASIALRDVRSLGASAAVVLGVVAGCTSNDQPSSARFVERTTQSFPGGRTTTATTRGAFDWSTLTGQASVTGYGQTEGVIQIGGDCYLRYGQMRWRKDRADDIDGLCSAALFRDPRDELALMRTVASNFHEAGKATVRGAETTHWRGRLNIGGVQGSIELWTDDSGTVRRLRHADNDPKGGFVSVREYFDFGVDVASEKPASFEESG